MDLIVFSALCYDKQYKTNVVAWLLLTDFSAIDLCCSFTGSTISLGMGLLFGSLSAVGAYQMSNNPNNFHLLLGERKIVLSDICRWPQNDFSRITHDPQWPNSMKPRPRYPNSLGRGSSHFGRDWIHRWFCKLSGWSESHYCVRCHCRGQHLHQTPTPLPISMLTQHPSHTQVCTATSQPSSRLFASRWTQNE